MKIVIIVLLSFSFTSAQAWTVHYRKFQITQGRAAGGTGAVSTHYNPTLQTYVNYKVGRDASGNVVKDRIGVPSSGFSYRHNSLTGGQGQRQGN